VLEVLREQLGQPVRLGVCPQVGVEPAELVGGPAPDGRPHKGLVRVEDHELGQDLLGLAARLVGCEQRLTVIEGSGDDSEEFDDGLMRNADLILGEPPA